MKKSSLIFISLFLASGISLSAQNFQVDKGASFISGMGSFVSQGDELYEDRSGNRQTTIRFIPGYSYFLAPNFFIGGSLELLMQKWDENYSNSVAVGPHFGYAFGDEDSDVFPYLSAGGRYVNQYMDNDIANNSFNLSGTDFYFGAGTIVPLKKHIGITFEASYHFINLKESGVSYTGDVISVGLGITGMLF